MEDPRRGRAFAALDRVGPQAVRHFGGECYAYVPPLVHFAFEEAEHGAPSHL